MICIIDYKNDIMVGVVSLFNTRQLIHNIFVLNTVTLYVTTSSQVAMIVVLIQRGVMSIIGLAGEFRAEVLNLS